MVGGHAVVAERDRAPFPEEDRARDRDGLQERLGVGEEDQQVLRSEIVHDGRCLFEVADEDAARRGERRVDDLAPPRFRDELLERRPDLRDHGLVGA